jgi:hypothetical protein
MYRMYPTLSVTNKKTRLLLGFFYVGWDESPRAWVRQKNGRTAVLHSFSCPQGEVHQCIE